MKKRRNNYNLRSFRMDEELWRKIDLLVKRNGYHSKTQFLTALVTAAVRGIDASEEKYGITIPKSAGKWISENTPRLSEQEIRTKLDEIIEDMIMPVIAVKGAEIACDTAMSEIRSRFRDETDIWLTESEIKSAIEEYELLNTAKLSKYREDILSGREGDT